LLGSFDVVAATMLYPFAGSTSARQMWVEASAEVKVTIIPNMDGLKGPQYKLYQ
jgi:hypothetical protein